MAEPQKVTLPPQLNQRIVAGLSLEERLALYQLTLEMFLTERKKTNATEDLVNYRYHTFFADLHGPEAHFPQLVKGYAARILSEGWEPLWWYAPLPRDINGTNMDLVRVVTVRIGARRLRADVTMRRQ